MLIKIWESRDRQIRHVLLFYYYTSLSLSLSLSLSFLLYLENLNLSFCSCVVCARFLLLYTYMCIYIYIYSQYIYTCAPLIQMLTYIHFVVITSLILDFCRTCNVIKVAGRRYNKSNVIHRYIHKSRLQQETGRAPHISNIKLLVAAAHEAGMCRAVHRLKYIFF